MPLQNRAKRVLHFADLQAGESSFLSSADPLVGKASSELLFRDIIVHRNLSEVFETALNVGHDRRLCASGGC